MFSTRRKHLAPGGFREATIFTDTTSTLARARHPYPRAICRIAHRRDQPTPTRAEGVISAARRIRPAARKADRPCRRRSFARCSASEVATSRRATRTRHTARRREQSRRAAAARRSRPARRSRAPSHPPCRVPSLPRAPGSGSARAWTTKRRRQGQWEQRVPASTAAAPSAARRGTATFPPPPLPRWRRRLRAQRRKRRKPSQRRTPPPHSKSMRGRSR
jgi:hypothetical protein